MTDTTDAKTKCKVRYAQESIQKPGLGSGEECNNDDARDLCQD